MTGTQSNIYPRTFPGKLDIDGVAPRDIIPRCNAGSSHLVILNYSHLCIFDKFSYYSQISEGITKAKVRSHQDLKLSRTYLVLYGVWLKLWGFFKSYETNVNELNREYYFIGWRFYKEKFLKISSAHSGIYKYFNTVLHLPYLLKT